jgi:hypothetical protein
MHDERDRTQDALRVIDKPDKLPQAGPPAQVNQAAQFRVIMAGLADLHELDAPAEMVHHTLKPSNATI